jgi:homoserine kinase
VREKMLEIRIPATTANLGPGFDALGAALSLYAKLTFEECEEKLIIYGCEDKYKNEGNLIYISYCKTFERFEERIKNVKIGIESDIPASRGLGSSAACVVAGVAGALYMMGKELDKDIILEIATEVEGHPDNVSPAIFGGLTASMKYENKVFTKKHKVHDSIIFHAFIPNFPLSTSEARGVLPNSIPFEDVVFNISRIPLLLKGFEENNKELINVAIQDRLHQPYRKMLISGYDEIEKICRQNGGYGVYLSGAGPTMMCISDDKECLYKLEKSLEKMDNWTVKGLRIDNEGIKILRS